ncbi:MAG: hypothetical protein GEU86_19825 [Actinophytocola sp.]|nr:hypothetical protein [Actinophytocola sp.]
MTAPAIEKLATGRSLISDLLFHRLAAGIVKDNGVSRERAERIVDQALAFLAACALNRDEQLAPSEQVDIGWHTFILHTRDYRSFCARYAPGRFIDHVPTDDEAHGPAAKALLLRTVEAIRAAGFAVDMELWPEVTRCSQCHAGCTDSP